MTENPTIPSPSGPPQPTFAASTNPPEDAENHLGEIQCICEISDDDGFTICCDICDSWQHLVCVQLTKENLPAKYYCPKCSPRTLDIQKAKDIQRQRRAEEQAKRSHKKKRPVATSHKKKEHTNGTAPGKSSLGTDKTTTTQGLGKPPSPKENQQPSSRKRGHRGSQSISNPPIQSVVGPATFNNIVNDTISLDSPRIAPPTHNGDTESDTDYENKRDFATAIEKYGEPSQAFIEKPVSTTHLMAECSCSGANDCPMKSEHSALKPPISNGRRKAKRNASLEPNISVIPKEPSSDSGPPNDEDDDDSRSVSAPSSRSKPRSRDLTPSASLDTAIENEMTARDARKLKDVLSLIEKQEQPQPVKRRKRNSTVSRDMPAGTLSLPRPKSDLKDGTKGADANKKQKVPNSQNTPYSPTVTTPASMSVEYSVTDASVGRRGSNSPVPSESGKSRRRASVSPTGQNNGGDSKHRSKTITKPQRLVQFKDASMQTDPIEDEVPWWRLDPKMSPPRPPRLPLRKRLMRSMLRDRDETGSISTEDRKRKYDEVSSNPESTPPSKSPKLSCGGSVSVPNATPTDIKQSAETERMSLQYTTANTVKSAAQDSVTQISTIHVLDIHDKSTPPPGPALADIFADSDSTTSYPSQGSVAAARSPTELSPKTDQSQVNGNRSELQVQLPTPTTPSTQSAPTPGPVSLQSPLTVVPHLANANSVFNTCLAQPSPTRTKKLSLKDYGKRKQKVEVVDKADERLGTRYSTEGVPSNSERSPSHSSPSEEPRKLADHSSELMQVVTSPSSEMSSHMILDPTRVPTGPKEHRTGNHWHVR
ncbi:hypothetical protein P167DRAFT_402427 [Morchella conica CCBAS932]|uniref:PHD-type domain-containing protein n=2 Tax=Morchella sect. Distantes TaxID=1051054 RepID=A0A3N4KNX7_9PEZI|nr:hypothetical protein P167DRAFT_402427 [Morchella conica CCBAS932]